MIIYLLIIAVLSGILYRLGGIGGSGKFLPKWMFDTKMRDAGCAVLKIVCLLFILKLQAPIWAHILTFGLTWGSLTTYCDYFGTDNVEWYEWGMTGLMYGCASLPYLFSGSVVLLWFIVYTILMTLLIMGWSVLIKKAWLEEWGRGFIIIMLLLILVRG